jgi:ribulose-5-phosphate 4-epimerase/fuculose-1-phosphate aldolase
MTNDKPASDGYIKFNCDWDKHSEISSKDIMPLNTWRNRLYALNLIGAYPSGIGFGNISVRTKGDEFIITGSATGNYAILTQDCYSKVVGFDIDKNYLKCIGLRQASSESMTHATIYSIDSKINAVIHVHHQELWKMLLHKVSTASKDATYGTPEIAREMIRLFNDENAGKKGIIVTEGHQEGVFTFGKDLDTAGNILMEYFHKL